MEEKQTISIYEMFKGVRGRIDTYYKDMGIDEDKWWKDVTKKMAANGDMTEETAKNNIDHLTNKAENLKKICLATGLSGDYLLGLTDKRSETHILTYKDVFYYAKRLIDEGGIYEYVAPNGTTYYRLRKDLEDIVRSCHEMRLLIYEWYPERTELFEPVMNAWIETQKELFSEHEDKEEINRTLAESLSEQMSEASLEPADLLQKYNDFICQHLNTEDKDPKSQKNSYEYVKIEVSNTISKYKNGQNSIPLAQVIAFSKYFGKSVDYFLGLNGIHGPLYKSMIFDIVMNFNNISGLLSTEKFNHAYDENFNWKQIDEIEIVYVDNILKCFCKEYSTSCKQIDELFSDQEKSYKAELKKERFDKITNEKEFMMPIKPIVRCNETTLKGCKEWIGTHKNGQTYEQYIDENDDTSEWDNVKFNKDEIDEILKSLNERANWKSR